MAPRAPTSRAAVINWLRSLANTPEPSPRQLGSPTVVAGIVFENGSWRIREAVFDHAGFDALIQSRRAAGRNFYPEDADAFRLPTGRILVEATNLEDFIRAVEAYDWPRNW